MQRNQHIAELGPLLARWGIQHTLLCPGSRNAPLTQLFTSREQFSCHSVVDERSAGYVALGMARQLEEPVAVVTTSGTAVLNLAPAMAEAFHQRVPLVAITADRPLEKIPRFNNQWLDQEAPFFTSTKGFYQTPPRVNEPEDLDQIIMHLDALLGAAVTRPAGPVHLNIPLEEPLYEPLPEPVMGKYGEHTRPGEIAAEPAGEIIHQLRNMIPSQDSRVLVLAGTGYPDPGILHGLAVLLEQHRWAVVAEHTANLTGIQCIAHPELIMAMAGEPEREALRPDLLLSFGGQVISKRLKHFLQSLPDLRHHELAPWEMEAILKYGTGDHDKGDSPAAVPGISGSGDYLEAWKKQEALALEAAGEKLKNLPFGNFQAIRRIMERIPAGWSLHLGNSAAVRYAHLVPAREDLTCHANRGTSGIDGCVSTAVGAAMVSDEQHLLVVGDLGFVYDSNAMWNKDFPGNLRVVVLNDGGGGIFRLLEGPSRMDFFEEFSVTHHPVSLELLSQAFGRGFLRAENGQELEEKLESLFMPGNMAVVLEVDTTGSENSRIFKDFFDQTR